MLLEPVGRALEEVSAPEILPVPVAGHRALLCHAVAESRIVMPPCATSDVLPDQYVTIEIFDAGVRRCTSVNSRGEATKIW